jgi:CRISPR-associated protein Cas2
MKARVADFLLSSRYQAMWLFAMFDLPVLTRENRRQAARFRKDLLARGFQMLQLSVYARYCSGDEIAARYREMVHNFLPEHGQVRLMSVTEVQFGKMQVYFGKTVAHAEQKPKQFLLF